LDVLGLVSATARERDDVIEVQLFGCTALNADASIPGPHEKLHVIGNQLTSGAIL
jgi:hypothetical protein